VGVTRLKSVSQQRTSAGARKCSALVHFYGMNELGNGTVLLEIGKFSTKTSYNQFPETGGKPGMLGELSTANRSFSTAYPQSAQLIVRQLVT